MMLGPTIRSRGCVLFLGILNRLQCACLIIPTTCNPRNLAWKLTFFRLQAILRKVEASPSRLLQIEERTLRELLSLRLLWRPGEGVSLPPHAGSALVEAYLAVLLDRLNDLAVVSTEY